MKGDISQENTKNFKKTFFLFVPHIQTNSPPLHQKMYWEIISFCAFNVLKLKLQVMSEIQTTVECWNPKSLNFGALKSIPFLNSPDFRHFWASGIQIRSRMVRAAFMETPSIENSQRKRPIIEKLFLFVLRKKALPYIQDMYLLKKNTN